MRLQVILKVGAEGEESDTGSGDLLGTDHKREVGNMINWYTVQDEA